MMKINRKVLYIFSAILCLASIYAWMENKYYTPEIKNHSVPDESESLKKIPPKEVHSDKKIPNFVAGRTVLIEEAKRIYQNKTEMEKNEKSLGRKLTGRAISQNQSLYFSSVNVTFMNDLYACAQNECEKSDSLVTTNGFYIFKGNAPKSLDSKSRGLVTYDREINQYGIWQGRVIIETHSSIDLTPILEQMKFETIERPQETLFIAQYVGKVSRLDDILNQLKSISDIAVVRLEITYSRNRGN